LTAPFAKEGHFTHALELDLNAYRSIRRRVQFTHNVGLDPNRTDLQYQNIGHWELHLMFWSGEH
uniref:hypothetical protein n=1 Tax=Alicyclobacillus sendaiensis TaxID=192387 RepID=UPI0026F43BAF